MAKVLMTDEDGGFSVLVGHYLSSVGHSVTVAGNASESLIWLNLASFDLLVMDVNRAEGTMLDLCRRVKRHSNTANTRVLVLSEAPEFKRQAIDAGADVFLAEPLSLEQIKGHVRDLTQNLAVDSVPFELVA